MRREPPRDLLGPPDKDVQGELARERAVDLDLLLHVARLVVFRANPNRRRLNRLPAFPADGAVRAPRLAYLFHWKRVIAARLCGGLGETALPAARPLSVERQKQKGRIRDRNRKHEAINLNGQ